ncbi:DNRLRE domain-containing protein [Paenibacillus sp. IB182496]|uniref:DNRLRE domain-containing protein n=1 Tax=Paenibacillus sabuli TaxID=2772509 RepID=A0A927GRF0_9BACL|nr:DNRLRE domain-containing protein [Paenibacillus sabuli]MBD2845564.1 DNRLRE domain-containing protein [Paenibacillus sabuli]
MSTRTVIRRAAATLGLTALLAAPGAIVSADDGALIFQSGFEPGSVVNATYTDITGADQSLPERSDWELDLEEHPAIGWFNLQYEGGTAANRYATIVEDPTQPGNQVLQYWLKDAVTNNKGRIQANVYRNTGLEEMYYRHRWFVPGLVEQLEDMGTFSWLTVSEFWNDEGWLGGTTPFRISVGLRISADGEGLNFHIHGQKKLDDQWRTMWETTNTAFTLPYDAWMDVEYYFLEGDEDNGRFYMAITPESGPKQVIFALETLTHHPDDAAPNGLNGFNPLKMYCGQDVTSYMASRGVLQWYYDDFELWEGAPDTFDPDTVSWSTLAVTDPQPPPDLDTYLLEFEDMLVTGSQPSGSGGYEIVNDPSLSGGAGVRLLAEDVDDYIQFATDMQQGDYEIELGVRRGPDQGTAQFWTLGGNKGAPIDLYAASETAATVTALPTVSPSTSNIKTTRFIVTGKDGASSGYGITLDYLKLTTIRPEVTAVSATPGNYTTGQSVDVTVSYSMPVTVTTGEDLPYIALELTSGGPAYAYYLDGSGTTELRFRYTVEAGHLDADGLALGAAIVPNDSRLESARSRHALTALHGIEADSVYVNAPAEGNTPAPGVVLTVPWTLTAAADSFVRSGTDPDNPYTDVDRNYGRHTTLQAKGASTGSDDRETYYKFDISALHGEVTSAELHLHVYNSNNGVAQAFAVADDSWDELELTWNNRPAAESSALDAVSGLQSGNWTAFDVTDAVYAEAAAAQHWLTLNVKDATGFGRYVGFSSREHTNGNAPTLSVEAAVETLTPAIVVVGNPDGPTSGPVALDVFATADSHSAITAVKWAAGAQSTAYFATGGAALTAPYELEIAANGVYTLYAEDTLGNASVYHLTVSQLAS